MPRVPDLRRRPSWWGPDVFTLPVAFWLSVLAGVAATVVAAEVVLRLSFSSLYSRHGLRPGSLTSGDIYSALLGALGAWPPLQLWKHAFQRRGLHSWDD